MTASAFGQLSVTSSTGPITINDNSTASPIPSTNIVASGATLGVVEKVTVKLNGLTHGYPDDLDIALRGPNGAVVMLWSDAGGQNDLVGADVTLDSTAGTALSDEGQVASGVYKPSNFDGLDGDSILLGALPSAPVGTDLAAFNGLAATAIEAPALWSLYISDDTTVDSGTINSWTLNLYMSPVLFLGTASTTISEDGSTTVNLLVNDTDSALSGLTLTATSSDTSIIPNAGLTFGGNTGGTNRTLSITPAANANGSVTITVTVKDEQNQVIANVNQKTFTVNVTAVNDAPSLILGALATSVTQGGISSNIVIHLRDVDSSPAAVTLTATSSNPAVIPATNVLFRTLDAANPGVGDGTNRVVQIAAGAAVGASTITIIATDSSGATNAVNIDVTVTPVSRIVAANPTPIVVPDSGTASPYPSTITIPANANVANVGKVVVSLLNVEHHHPSELGILLVSPSGTKVVLMRGAGDGNPVGIGSDGTAASGTNDVRLTFDVDASAGLSSAALITSTNRASDILSGLGDFPPFAPVGPYSASLSAFQGDGAAGVWSLYVYDINPNSLSPTKIAGGWLLDIHAAPVIASIANVTTQEDKPITVSFSVVDVDGITTNVVATSSDTAIVPNPSPANVGNVNGLTSGTFTFSPAANANGSVTITLTATDNQNFTSTRSFTLTVTPLNDAPTQSIIPKQLARAGQSVGPVSFAVGDLETAAANLIVSATSNNPKLLPPGSIILGGSGATRTITIFPAGAQAGQADITITVTDTGDGVNPAASSSQTFDLTVNEAASPLFENTAGIQVLDPSSPAVSAASAPFPSVINVSGLQGVIAEVQVTLFGITHPQPDDLDVLLVGPGTAPVALSLMSDAGGPASNPLNNVTLRFRQSASGLLPDETQIISGDYQPTDYSPNPDFPAFGSPGTTTASLSSFVDKNPNGDWKLYVVDDAPGPRGGVISSWQLNIRTKPALAVVPDQTTLEDTPLRFTVSLGDNQPGVPYVLAVGTDIPPGQPDVIDTIQTSTGQTIGSGGVVLFGGSQTLTINPVADASGTNTVILLFTDPDNNQTTRTFKFIVTPVNDPPRFGTVNNTNTAAATPITFTFDVTDPEGSPVNVSATSSNQGVVRDSGIGLVSLNSVTRFISISPLDVANGSTTITLTASDAEGQKSVKTFVLTVTPNVSFLNAAAITISDNSSASPYPATIDVSGVNGSVSGASVVLVGFTHPYPDDVDVLLVAPDGRAVMLMSDAGGGTPVSNLRLTFSDSSAVLPDDTFLSSGTYSPSNYSQAGEVSEMPFPAPAAPGGVYSTSLSSLAGVNPNGQWKLFVRDDTFPDGGSISGGWILLLKTAPTITQLATQNTSEDTALPIRFTVSDQDTPVSGLTVGYSVQASGTGFNNPGLLTLGGISLVTNSSSFPDVNYTLTVLPSTNRPATSAVETNSVTITVTDGTSTASTTFLVRVSGLDDAPVIAGAFVPTASFSYATNKVVTAEDTPITVQFQVYDVDSTLGTSSNIVIQSSNPALVPNATANISKSGPDNQIPSSTLVPNTFTVTVTLTPALNQSGTTDIAFIVADRSQTSTNIVTLQVTPVNDLPTIAFPTLTSSSPTVSVGVGNSITVPITVGDVETASQDIVVTATAPSGSQSVIPNANLVLGGRGADRTLTITAIGTVTTATTINVTVTANDNTSGITTATLPVTVTPPPGQIITSAGAITIPATGTTGPASPYPSTIVASGLIGNVSKISVSIDGLTHAAPDDLDILLVSPAGKKVMLMSDAGGRNPVAAVQLIFDGNGRGLPDEGVITTGTYQPADFEPGVDVFPASAPSGPYASSLQEFIGTTPNGTWSLYIVDDATGDVGQIATGWSLRIETAPSISLTAGLNQPSGTPTFVQFAEDTTATIQFTINDPVTPPQNLSVSFASSTAGLVQSVVTNWVSSGPGANQATINAVIQPSTNAFGTNNLTVVVRRSDGAQSSIVVPMDITAANDVPLVSRLIDRTTQADTALVVPIAITDYEANLGRIWVSASSGAPSVISSINILLAGRTNVLKGLPPNATSVSAFPSGTSDTWTGSITIVPNTAAFSTLPVPITLVVKEVDANGADVPGQSTTVVFNVTVNAVNHAPTLTALPALVAVEAGKSTTNIVFAVADPDSDSPLVITATSDRQDLVRDQDIVIDIPSGSGGSRFIRVPTQPGVTGDANIAVRVTDPSGARGAASFVVRSTPTRERVFSNRAPIAIRDNNSSDPYPSQISVSGFSGNVSRVTVTLNGFWHTFPDDADLLLVSPAGQKVLLMSDAGGGSPIPSSAALTLKFDDTEGTAVAVPDNTALQSKTYKVANYEATTTDDFVNRTPAGPAGPYAEVLSAFNGFSPNGTWSLYAIDDTPSDAGAITNGWSLGITTLPLLSGLQDLVSQEDVPARQTFLIAEESFADTANYSFTVASSNPALVPSSVNNIVVTGTGTSRTVQIIPVANANTNNAGGTATITLTEQTTGVVGTFKVTFTPVNDLPQITSVANQTVAAGSFLTIPGFNYSDVETAKKDLRILPIESSNTAVIPSSNVTISGTDLRIFAGTQTGTSTITIRIADLGDGINGPTTNSISFDVAVTTGFNTVVANNSPITINDNAKANPYPSTLEVRGVNGSVATVTVTLLGLTHPFPDDVDVLLVGPNGQGVVLMSDAGAGGNAQTALNNASLIFSDAVSDSLPDNAPITPFNAYKPSNYEVNNSEFPSPAPAGPYSATLTGAFGGINPNGTWSLYVMDDASPDAGSIGGWVVNIALNEVGPTLSGLTDTNVVEDAFVQIPFTVGSATVDAVTFDTSSSNPALVSSIKVGGSGTDRVLQVTLVPNASGTSEITLVATDATGFRTRKLQLTVAPGNDLPTFGAVADARITGVTNLVLNVTDIDTALDQLVFFASTAGVGLIDDVSFIVNGANVFAKITPANNAQGTEVLTISVSDGSGSVSQTFRVTVVPAGPPIIVGTLPDITTPSGQSATIRFDVTDSDTPLSELAFSASAQGNLVSDVRFDLISGNTVALTVTPAAGQFGSDRITVQVSDGTSTARASFGLTVVSPGPVISPIVDQSTTEDVAITVPIGIADADTPLSSLTLFASTTNPDLVSDVTFITVGPNTTATISLVTNAFGVGNITITVSDGSSTASRTFKLTVTEVCEPPVIGSIGAQNATGSTISVNIPVTDPDDAVSKLSFQASTAGNSIVTGVTFTPSATGATALFTLADNASGTEQVTIQVSDGCSSDTETFSLTATSQPAVASLSVTRSGGNITLNIAGTPGQTYVIEGSTDFRTWTAIGSVTIDANGGAQITVPASSRSRFFRTRSGSAPVEAPLVYEGFSYDAGSPISATSNGGSGWSGAWIPDAEGPATNHVVLPSSIGYVDATGKSLVTSGGSAFYTGTNVPGGDIRSFRVLNAPRTNGTTWISFLGFRSGPTGGTTANPFPRAANLSFYDGGTEKFAIGNGSGAASNLWSVLPAGSVANVTNAQRSARAFDQLSLIVIRIDHKGNTTDDLYMWVNPSLGAEPSTATAAASSIGAFGFSFDRIRPFVGGLDTGNSRPPAELTFDELRIGTSFASVTPFTVRADVTQPGNVTAVVNGTDAGGAPPGAEGVEHTIDNAGQKYLNFTKRGSGFTVTTPAATLVTGIRLWTANDAVERDPASYKIEGSTTGAGGTFVTISEGALALPNGRNAGGTTTALAGGYFQEVSFANTTAYTAYRVTFPLVKNATSANSMQIAEVELLGPVLP